MELLVQIVEISTRIGSPLALGGLALSLFFGLSYSFSKNADWRRLPPRGVVRLLMVSVTYAFVLSLCALFLGVAAWSFAYFVGPFVTQNQVTNYLERKDYNGAISVAEPYVALNPKDDIVRHMLGTSYYATGRFKDGVRLYEDMEQLYSSEDNCSPRKAAAISSLAAFQSKAGEPKLGLEESVKLINCPNVTEPYVYNHLLLEAENNIPLDMPKDFKFGDSYWQSKYSLLQYTQQLLQRNRYDPTINRLLIDAYCEDEKTRSIIAARFDTGDFSSSPLLVQDFKYEMKALDILSTSEKVDVLDQLKAADCVKQQ